MRHLVFIVIAAISIGIAVAQNEQRLVVVARLVEFSENAEWLRFSDGAIEWHHLSKFVVLAPSNLCGKELDVFHASLPGPDTPWRQIGKAFEIALSDRRAGALLGEEPRDQHATFYGTSWTEVLAEVEPDGSDCLAEAP
jgi:hypothetical protein